MIKLKDILNEIEYDSGDPLTWIGGFRYTWEHGHSIPFKASSLEVVDWDEYPDGDAMWVSYVYQGESPFALNVDNSNETGETGLESSKKGGLINKIVSLFKKELPALIKMKKPIYPVIAITTDNHWSKVHNRTIPTSIYIYVGTDETKNWALPRQDTSYGGMGFRADTPSPEFAKNRIKVYAATGVKDKYPRPKYFNKDMTDAQKKFIGDMVKAIWEKPNEGITSGKWVIRKTIYDSDEYGLERTPPKSDYETKTDIGFTDPRLKDGFWNMEKGQWGPYKDATIFNDRAIKSIRKARYVIKTKDAWETVLISK